MTPPKTRAVRLFHDTGWSFLVDAVRVRPLHEEMTASLLEEVEKLRAKKTARRSATLKPSRFAETVRSATASTSSAAANDPAAIASTTTADGTRDSRSANATTGTFKPPSEPTLGGRRETGAASTTLADDRYHPPVGVAVALESDSSGGQEKADVFVGSVGKEGGRSRAADDDQKPSSQDQGAVVGTVQRQVETAAAAKGRLDSERRLAALAAIDKRRSHHKHHHHTAAAAAAAAATATSAAATVEGPVKALLENSQKQPGAATVSSTTRAVTGSRYAAGFRPSLGLLTAFSKQSVRSGRTLGYYGREEVDVLSAISKNPSRIAAYNRITEGKTGKNGEKPSSEVGTI